MKTNVINFAFISLILFASACNNAEEVKTPSKEELLTSNASKNWKLDYSSSDQYETSESCTAASTINADNEWIFNVNGDFKFVNGTITEIPECEDCCSDLANLVGNWSIFSNGDSLSIIVDGRIDNGVITPEDELELVRARIKSLTKDEMVLTALGDTTIYVALPN